MKAPADNDLLPYKQPVRMQQQQHPAVLMTCRSELCLHADRPDGAAELLVVGSCRHFLSIISRNNADINKHFGLASTKGCKEPMPLKQVGH